jgi:uncharacterized phiE125 gp8 family phage protein
MHRLRLVTDAASEPLTLAEAKAYARVDASDEDALITSLIAAARRRVEKETSLALLTQTWVAVFDALPGMAQGGLASEWWDGVREGPISSMTQTDVIEIDKRPFQAVTNIRFRGADGAYATVDQAVYFTEVSDYRGRIIRSLGQVWPVVIMAPSGGVEITFTAGFGDAAASVPADLIQAMKVLVKHWFDKRDLVTDGTYGTLPESVCALLASWRALRLR